MQNRVFGICSRRHHDGQIEWIAPVYRDGTCWVATGFETKEEALACQRRLAQSVDSNQLSWISPRLLSVQEAAALLSVAPGLARRSHLDGLIGRTPRLGDCRPATR